MSDHDERRRAPRLQHRAYAALDCGEESYAVHVLNISSCGALVAVLDEHELQAGDTIELRVESEGGVFMMRGKVAHVKHHYLGLECFPEGDSDKARMDSVIDELSGLER